MAARTRSRPLYAVFLERVIQIEAVQRHRAAITDDRAWAFFTAGYRPGVFEGFLVPRCAGGGFRRRANRFCHDSRFAPYETRVGRGGRGL